MPKGVYKHSPQCVFQKGNKINLGKKQTEIHKRKIGIANTGKHPTKEARDKMRLAKLGNEINLGKHHSDSVKKKISESHKGKVLSQEIRRKMSLARQGDKNPAWKGGVVEKNQKIRMCVETRLWREEVYKRDKFTCQKCKDNMGRNLNTHHIQNFIKFIELRFTTDNGITLCKKCHLLFHKTYSFRNNNQEQINQFINI